MIFLSRFSSPTLLPITQSNGKCAYFRLWLSSKRYTHIQTKNSVQGQCHNIYTQIQNHNTYKHFRLSFSRNISSNRIGLQLAFFDENRNFIVFNLRLLRLCTQGSVFIINLLLDVFVFFVLMHPTVSTSPTVRTMANVILSFGISQN